VQRIAAVIIVASSLALAATAVPGCFGHECEGDVITIPYGEAPGEGEFLDEASWESAPVAEKWISFPGGRTRSFRIPSWERAGRSFVGMSAYISQAEIPNEPHCCGLVDNWTEGTGIQAEFHDLSPGRFKLTNTTCTDFFMRVVVHAGDARQDSGAGDAQTE
jgi:hypothetical protein